MASFDFITDEGLRTSLDSDLRELSLCYEVKAWKAVHVLAGSIIESVLIDYLVSSRVLSREEANSKLLADMIDLCSTKKLLTKKAINLSSIVRNYRNLIHPGLALRTEEKLDEHGAAIAKSVVEIVTAEVSSKKRETYGYTAEQVVRKVIDDSSSSSIMEHLLKETPQPELTRLLLRVLPEEYIRVRSDFEVDPETDARLAELYRLGIRIAGEELCSKIGSKYVEILKEQSEWEVRCYELGLFRGSDLTFIASKDRQLVIDHFLASMKSRMDRDVATAAHGITDYLSHEDFQKFLEIIAGWIRRRPSGSDEHAFAMSILSTESWRRPNTPPDWSDRAEAAFSAILAKPILDRQLREVLLKLKDEVIPF